MTDILSTNDCLFTKNDMIMTDNGYYASMPMLYPSAADTSAADTNHHGHDPVGFTIPTKKCAGKGGGGEIRRHVV